MEIKANKIHKSRGKLRCIDHQIHAGLMPESLRATIGPLQDNRPIFHYVIEISRILPYIHLLPYKHVSRSLENFSACTVLSRGSIMIPPRRPRVFARLARWQKGFRS